MDAPSATGSSVTVRRDAAAVAWWVLVGAASGAIAGALVGGVGGRLAMLLLRLTSPDDVIGMTSDDGFEIGVFSFDTAQLVLAMAMLGAINGVLYAALRGAIPRKLRLPLWSVFAAALGGASIVHDDGVDFAFLEPAALAIALFVLLPGAAAALVVLLVERWMRVEPWSDRRLSIGLCIGAVAGTFALGLAGLVAAGALVVRRAGLDSLLARVARFAVPAALVVVTAVSCWQLAAVSRGSSDKGVAPRARTLLDVATGSRSRLQRGVERLTLFRAVRMVATVALSLAVVAAVLELARRLGDQRVQQRALVGDRHGDDRRIRRRRARDDAGQVDRVGSDARRGQRDPDRLVARRLRVPHAPAGEAARAGRRATGPSSSPVSSG